MIIATFASLPLVIKIREGGRTDQRGRGAMNQVKEFEQLCDILYGSSNADERNNAQQVSSP